MKAHFGESYRGTPPWDIGRPQPEFVRLADSGAIRGAVLDVGCGTGENAMYFAGLGLATLGLDAIPLAIEKAMRKAEERGSSAEFVVGDALHLEDLKRRFDTITDCGLFHSFTNRERVLFARSLKSALMRSGTYFMLCFSEKEPDGWGGPRRISKKEIAETFRKGWKIDWIREARMDTNLHKHGGYGWLSSITSTDERISAHE